MALAFFGGLVVQLDAQNVTLARSGESIGVRVQGPGLGLGLLKGDTLTRLKDGRAVRVEFDLTVLPGPGGGAAAHARQTFVLSYDLWEERFAVTLVGPPARSTSYLTAAAAEAWCLEHVTIPVGQLGKLRDAPFWIRLEYRVPDGDSEPVRNEESGLSLRGMIEALSRRSKTGGQSHAVEAGPFRIR
jgi:hypothetical protein